MPSGPQARRRSPPDRPGEARRRRNPIPVRSRGRRASESLSARVRRSGIGGRRGQHERTFDVVVELLEMRLDDGLSDYLGAGGGRGLVPHGSTCAGGAGVDADIAADLRRERSRLGRGELRCDRSDPRGEQAEDADLIEIGELPTRRVACFLAARRLRQRRYLPRIPGPRFMPAPCLGVLLTPSCPRRRLGGRYLRLEPGSIIRAMSLAARKNPVG